MRLTLRTLLAYLNDVLTPAEAEPLKQRIEESEFASTLVQRIRHVLRRLRLSAPKVDGRGLGFDANSVAEYLDSTMSPERVADFEKVCLESDVHLAEVAAGYEILAKVLSEHANVPESLRTRVYALRDAVPPTTVPPTTGRSAPAPPPAQAIDDGQHSEKEQGATKPSAVQPPEPPPPPPEIERIKPQVPDYLKPDRRPSRSAWPLVPLALLAIAGIAFCVPPLSQYNPLLNSSPQITQNNEAEKKANPVQPVPPADKVATDKNSKGEADSGDKETGDNNVGNQDGTKPEDPAVASIKPALPITDSEADKDSVSKPDGEEEKKSVDPDEAVAKNDLRPAPEEGSAVKPGVKSASIAPSAGAELGRFISDETVLASFSPTTKGWVRVPPRSLILDGQKFVSLPLFRNQIALATGSQLTFVGEASVSFTRDKETELPVVVLEYGRLLLQSNALQNVQTNLSLNGLRGTLTLDTADSVAAIEVYSYLPPGSDPLAANPAHLTIANIIGVSGSCTWEEQGAAGVTIQANSVQILINGEESRKRTRVQLPAWIDVANTDKLERDAGKLIEPHIPLDRSLTTALEEQIKSQRRFEVRFQVARCLAYLGHFEALVKQLADDKYHSLWMKHPDRPAAESIIETLRKHLARGGRVAEQVRADLAQDRGKKDADLLFRLLQGFNNEQLIKGDAKLITGGYDELLVAYLANGSMDVRVLAFDNLVRITGIRNLYDPSLSLDKSKSRIKAWQEDLDKGRIRYATEPSPLTEFKSLEIKTEEAEGKGR